MSEQEFSCLQGTREQVAQAVLAEQLPLLWPNLAPLAVKIWGGSHFKEYKISVLGRSLWSAHTWVTRRVSVLSAHPSAKS